MGQEDEILIKYKPHTGLLVLAGTMLIVGCGATSHQSTPNVSNPQRTRGVRVPQGPKTPTSVSLMSIAMTSNKSGWGVLTPSPNSPYFIVHTVDGGTTWRSAGPKTAFASTPDFFNDRTALAVVPGGHDRIALAYTDNTGHTWSSATGQLRWPSSIYRNLEPLQTDFLTKRKGFVFTSTYVNQHSYSNQAWIDYTADRGRTWKKIATPSGQKLGIAFATPRVGWLVVARANRNGPATTTHLFQTTDGGRRWELAALRRPARLSSAFSLQMVGIPHIFRSRQVAVVPSTWFDAATGRAVIAWSQWSARTGWTSQSSGVQANNSNAFAWLPHDLGGGIPWTWSSPRDGWFIWGGYLYQTTTGGSSWIRQTTVPAGVFSLNATSPTIGWALTSTNPLVGVTLSTTSRGGQWHPISPKLQ